LTFAHCTALHIHAHINSSFPLPLLSSFPSSIMAKGPRKSGTRNPTIGNTGVRRFSRSVSNSKGAGYKFGKKGDTRTAEQKAAAAKKAHPAAHLTSRWYAADDVKVPLKSNKKAGKPKLRKSLTAGTVVIILAGRFRGKRVIFLKQLESGMLLVTGPYKINGVPLRRVNSAYVLATSTKVDVSSADVAKIDDAFFARKETKKAKKSGEFIEEKKEKAPIAPERKSEQTRVDSTLSAAIKAVPNLYHYLNAKFSLTKGQKPHLLSF